MDVLIIGAGAAGLLAARELGRKGKKVAIFEARHRTGGRIYTLHDPAFALPVETGAEFVHGDLELTKKLLKEAGIEYYEITGDVWRAAEGRIEQQEDFIEQQDELLKKLKALEHDMSVNAFLNKYFSGEEYTELRDSLTSFVEGYDAADANHASCFSLLQELLGEEGQHARVKGGYIKLVDFLVDECNKYGCAIHLSTPISSIKWKAGEAIITTTDHRRFAAPKVLVTIPISILQLQPGEEGYIDINPLPVQLHTAIHALGSTGVIKIILQFKDAFWKEHAKTKQDKPGEIGFLFSDTIVPTWWTQLPVDNGILTGWLAGPSAVSLKDAQDDDVLQNALRSLSEIFSIDIESLREHLVAHHVKNWTRDPFTRGAYAYEKVSSKNAKRILNTPLENTLFFAGEALHEGPERGTVEAALLSAMNIVDQIS